MYNSPTTPRNTRRSSGGSSSVGSALDFTRISLLRGSPGLFSGRTPSVHLDSHKASVSDGDYDTVIRKMQHSKRVPTSQRLYVVTGQFGVPLYDVSVRATPWGHIDFKKTARTEQQMFTQASEFGKELATLQRGFKDLRTKANGGVAEIGDDALLRNYPVKIQELAKLTRQRLIEHNAVTRERTNKNAHLLHIYQYARSQLHDKAKFPTRTQLTSLLNKGTIDSANLVYRITQQLNFDAEKFQLYLARPSMIPAIPRNPTPLPPPPTPQTPPTPVSSSTSVVNDDGTSVSSSPPT